MIGEESRVSRVPSSPASTGQVPTLRHAAAAGLSVLGRIDQADELAAGDAEDGVGGDQ